MVKLDYLSHNWLVNKINNEIIKDNIHIFSGNLYDLGCGVKPYYEELSGLVDTYIGVDWMRSIHSHKMDLVADLNSEFPIESESADCIISLQVMEHLHSPLNFLEESHRILKNNGVILLTVPFQWHVHEAPYDFFRYTEFGLNHLFLKAGFEEVIITPNSGLWTTISLKINYELKKLNRGRGLVKGFTKCLLAPFWFFSQVIGMALDSLHKNSNETVSYTVLAKKLH